MNGAVKFLPAAEAEADEAIKWYEEREFGLGKKLRELVEHSIESIIDNPFSHPVVEGSRVRRALVDRFPYIVVYTIEPDFILIVSIFHTSRNPIIWRGRLK